MKLKIIKNYLKNNRCYQRNVKRKPIGIQLHTIGTGQGTAQAVADYWNQPSVSACVTYIVDCDTEGKVLQCLPEDVRSWADAGYGNDNLITFEICESDYIRYTGGASYDLLNADKFKADIMRGYNTAVLLCADICRRYGWNPTAKLPSGLYLISSHDEGRRTGLSSAHVDPTHVWDRFGLTMDGFRADVKKAMAGDFETVKPEPEKWYRVRKTWGDAGTQLGAYLSLDNAKANCPAGYTVYDWNGKAVYTNTATVSGTQTSEFVALSETAAAARLLEICRPIAEKNKLFPSVCAAQTILESGYCTTELARKANNVCGMKCTLSGNTWAGSTWDGVSKVHIRTAEQDKSGKVYNVNADFRVYPCIEDSVADRCAYLLGAKNGSRLRYDGIQERKNYREQIGLIKAGGYATDVAYVDKICNIIERFALDKYDQVADKPQELPGNDFLSTLLKFQEQLEKDIASGRKWIYSNSGCSSKMSTAIKKDNRKCNCALLVRWVLRKLGLLNGDNWWGEQGGTIVWRGTSKEQMLKHFDLIHVAGKRTVDQAIKDGTLQPGDIVTYVNMGHTNVYAGNGKWYDGGHAYASGSGEGAVFKSWYGNTVYGSQPIGYILRRRGSEQTEEKLHIVREGMYIKKANADRRCIEINNAGIDCIVKRVGDMWWTQCGAFKELENAEERVRQLRARGFDGMIK